MVAAIHDEGALHGHEVGAGRVAGRLWCQPKIPGERRPMWHGGEGQARPDAPVMRTISLSYVDPLDAIWLTAAQAMGIKVVRSADSYASYDGHGTLSLSDPSGMDPDDCLAQMILHEICHALVQGPSSFGWVDWGLDNVTGRDELREHACLRLQAALLEPHGLRRTLAPTTDFRGYYDALDRDPFAEKYPAERPSIICARAAFARRHRAPVGFHLEQALERTSSLLLELQRSGHLPESCLLGTIESPPPRHPSGLKWTLPPSSICARCAWSFTGEEGRLRCRQAGGTEVTPQTPSCDHFEAPFDCLSCGACCREAYDTVEVAEDDPTVQHHLPLLIERLGGYDMRRDGAKCCCLRGGVELEPARPAISGGRERDDAGEKVPPLFYPGKAPFLCAIYDNRPQTCRDFTIFSEHCLSARRRVGLCR